MLERKDIHFPTNTNVTSEILEAMLAYERPRLVRYCSQLTGNAEVAEDLAQETLIEAWRNLHKFEIHEAAQQSSDWKKWIAAIARNVCKRWARNYYRDRTHIAPVTRYSEDETETSLEDLPLENYDIELELERDELAQLLDRALALLPPAARDVLIERYIHEASHAEIAERLGLSEDALVQRLYRGKLALRRVITTQMREEAAVYGISTSDADNLQQHTRIWCPFCGKNYLIKDQDPSMTQTGFICPKCWRIANLSLSSSERWSGMSSAKSILSRQLAILEERYWPIINTGRSNCWKCGHEAQNKVDNPRETSLEHNLHLYRSIYILCPHCDFLELNGIPHLSLDTPEARQFWRKHPRIQWLPPREIEYAGQAALISSFRSMTDAAQLDIILHYTTLKVLAIHEQPQ